MEIPHPPEQILRRHPPGKILVPRSPWWREPPRKQQRLFFFRGSHRVQRVTTIIKKSQAFLKGLIAHQQSAPDSQCRSANGRQSRPQRILPVQETVPVKTPGCHTILQKHSYPIGTVGQHRWESHENKKGECQEGTSTSDYIDGTGHANQQQKAADSSARHSFIRQPGLCMGCRDEGPQAPR